MTYRLLINDAGPDGYSGYQDIQADALYSAKQLARAILPLGKRGVLLPLQEKPYWPDGTNPDAPPTLAQLLAVPGSCAVDIQ
jgi:hypothetical protein